MRIKEGYYGKKEFLPVGSVVLLKGGTKRVMVTGFCSVDNDDTTKIYDYTGCLYPEGIINSNEICLFNDNQIEQVFFLKVLKIRKNLILRRI